MDLSQAVDIFVKLAEMSVAQKHEFSRAISNRGNPTDPGLLQNAEALVAWKTQHQTNPSVMILSSRIDNLKRQVDNINREAGSQVPNYQNIMSYAQIVINEMQVLFNQQLRWPRQTTPIVEQMEDDARYILGFARAAAAEAPTEEEEPTPTPSA